MEGNRRIFQQEILRYVVAAKLNLNGIIEEKVSSVTIDCEKSVLSVVSRKKGKVATVFEQLHKTFQTFSILRRVESPTFLQCLRSIASYAVTKYLQDCKLMVGWSVGDNTLSFCSHNLIVCHSAFKAIDHAICQMTYPEQPHTLTASQRELINVYSFEMFILNLKSQIESLAANYGKHLNVIKLAFKKSKHTLSDYRYAMRCFRRYFESKGTLTAFSEIPLTGLQLVLLQKCKSTFEKCLKAKFDNKLEGVNIVTVGDMCIIECTSSQLCNKAVKVVVNILTNISEREFRVPKLSVSDWMKSRHSKQVLRDIDCLCRTVSKVQLPQATLGSSLEKPTGSFAHSLAVGWIFEHWSDLHQYQSLGNKVKIIKGYIGNTKV